MLPVEKNVLFVRFENIGDNYDAKNGGTDTTGKAYFVDVDKFARNLYQHVNGAEAKLNNVNIWESSLSGN